jgi:hypothetical protein
MGVYQLLLDHPDRAARAWRQLGAATLDITVRGPSKFGWSNPHGSDVTWETVHRSSQLHIWYAEGTVKAGLLFPPLPIRAVVLVHHRESPRHGQNQIQHRVDMFVQTDSKAAALLLRLIGPSVPRLTEQCLGQLEMFFSALAHYLHNHPDKAGILGE